MSNTRYPEEFRIEAAKQATERGYRVAEVASRLGVSIYSVHAWIKAYGDGITPEKFEKHTLVPHGKEMLEAPRTFYALKEWFKDKEIEGVVWHHPDGRMVKIKKKDF